MIDYSRTHNYQPPVLNNGGYDMHAAVDLEAAAEVRQPLLHRTGSKSPPQQDAGPFSGQQYQQAQGGSPIVGARSLPISTLPAHVQAILAEYGHVLQHSSSLPVTKQQACYTDPLSTLELPSAQRHWRSQRGIMVAWLVFSLMGLFAFAPFFLTTGLYMGAQLAGLMGVVGSCLFLCRSGEGVGLHVHARLASALSVTAAALDGLTVLLNLLIIWGVDCQQDETCRSVMTYVFIFSAYVALHCYLSHSIYKRARSVQAMLNPVSSGLVKL